MDTEPKTPDDTTAVDPSPFTPEPATGTLINDTLNTEPVAEPIMPGTEPEMPAGQPPNKGSNLVRNIIFAVVALIILGTVAAVVWKTTHEKSTVTKSQEVPVREQSTDTAESIVGKITTAITDRSASNYQSPRVTQSAPLSMPQVLSPSYKVPGTDYYVIIAKAYGLSATDSTSPDDPSVNQSFIQTLIDQSSATLIANKFDKTATLFAGTEYQSKDVVCFTSAPGNKPFTVTCADKSDYTSPSNAIEPFAAAYAASGDANGTVQSDSVFSTPTIKNSSVTGYQNATINTSPRQGVGGAILLFYQNSKSGWQFFMGTQNELSCNAYHSADEQAAFADFKCINSNGQEVTVGAQQNAPQGPVVMPPKQPIR